MSKACPSSSTSARFPPYTFHFRHENTVTITLFGYFLFLHSNLDVISMGFCLSPRGKRDWIQLSLLPSLDWDRNIYLSQARSILGFTNHLQLFIIASQANNWAPTSLLPAFALFQLGSIGSQSAASSTFSETTKLEALHLSGPNCWSCLTIEPNIVQVVSQTDRQVSVLLPLMHFLYWLICLGFLLGASGSVSFLL